jgi:hypothetical protein
MERDQRLADRDERAGICARCLLAQRHDRKEAEEADGDEDAFNDTSGDVSKGEDFVLPPDDRKQHDGGADVGDDEEQLQERSPQHAGVSAGTNDEVGIVQHRGVEKMRGSR